MVAATKMGDNHSMVHNRGGITILGQTIIQVDHSKTISMAIQKTNRLHQPLGTHLHHSTQPPNPLWPTTTTHSSTGLFVRYNQPMQEFYTPSQLNGLIPQDICTEFNNLHLNSWNSNGYMDTGVSSYITSNAGKITTPLSNYSNPIYVSNGQQLSIFGSGNDFYKIINRIYNLNQIINSLLIIKTFYPFKNLALIT